MEEKAFPQGLEAVLFRLLEKSRESDPLVLLCLVNLMGMINLIARRAWREEASGAPNAPDASDKAGGVP